MRNRAISTCIRVLSCAAIGSAIAVAPAHSAAKPAPVPGPGGARVATLEGLFMPVGVTRRQLSGEPCAYPNVCESVVYSNTGSKASYNDGVAKLDAWIRRTPGKKMVYGYSLGASVADAWLRKFNADPTTPPAADLSFLLGGNPDRAVTGTAIVNPSKNYGNGTGVGHPVDVKYPVTDVCKKWDSVCYLIRGDWRSSFLVHLSYGNAKLNDPRNIVQVVGNTRYVLIP